MLDQLSFAFSITGPVLLLLLIGWLAQRLGLVGEVFVREANALVYNIAFPIMLFYALSATPLNESIDWALILIGLFGTIAIVAILIACGRLIPPDQRGVFIQGGYRGNLAVLGVALAVATYGEGVLPRIALYLAVVTTAYNIVAVWVLQTKGAMRQMLRNPILIGIMAGVVGSALSIQTPQFMVNTGDYLTKMALPIALICIGASLKFNGLKSHTRSILLASFFKLFVSPLLLVGLGIWLGLRDERLAVLFFMSASPTATASYVMARKLTPHGGLAAEIIAVTTALGVLTYTIGLVILRATGLV